jgi:hypothetical protein
VITERAKKMGDALVAAKILTAEQLKKATIAANKGKSPSLIIGLMEEGFLTFKVFERFISATMGIRSAIIQDLPIDPMLINKIGLHAIKERRIFPIAVKEAPSGKTLALGMVDPTDQETIDGIQSSTGYKVIPVLISLPDFNNTLQKKYSPAPTVELQTQVTNEKIVLIRPGGYEEEVAFRSKAEKTKTMIAKPMKGISGETQEPLYDLQKDAPNRNIYMGPNIKKFKEEILAKLELMGTDVKVLKKETYTREVLHNDLGEVSNKPLELVYEKTNALLRIEAVINALIKNGLITKRDIITSAAVSYIFGEDKE